MTYHQRQPLRGIQCVRANGDTTAILKGLNSSFQEWKDRHGGEVAELQVAVDDANAKIAAMQMNGGTTAQSVLPAQTRNDFQRFMNAGSLSDSMKPRAEMQTGSSGDGGASVPKEIASTILDQMVEISPMRSLATVERATTTDYHKIVGLRGASSGWAGETDPRSITSTPKMGVVHPTFGELFAYCEATNWVLENSQFNLAAWLQDNVADEFAIKESAAFFTGDGASKPTGFLTATQSAKDDDERAFGTLQTVEGHSATGLEQDDFVNLMTALRTPYRQRQDCAWLMSRTTAAFVRKLKDAEGRFLWSDGLTEDAPPRLLGYRVVECEEMDAIGSGNIPVAFGNWRRGYLIADRNSMRVLRDPYTRPGWVRFYFHHRTSGNLMDSNAIKLLQLPAS